MTFRAIIMKFLQQEDLNFLLTNFIPRRLATRWMGRFSRIEHPLIRTVSLAVWQFFADVDLRDSQTTQFRSMHDCFTRRLKDGARPITTAHDILVSPCDALVGASGTLAGGELLQVKGLPYALADLLADANHADAFANGRYATLRLTSGMYHRFHAPHDCHVRSVSHIFGDRWNVNPITLRRVARLFCRNERAVIRTTLSAGGEAVTLVAVAAILVAGIRLRFLDLAAASGVAGQRNFLCDTTLRKGEEMGWFEHGSTIIVLAPGGFTLCEGVSEGAAIRVGQPLMRLPERG